MQTQRVQVTLAANAQLTTSDQWALLWSGLAAQFPLHNLHWKPATRTSIRTIQSLDVNLVALETVKGEGASQIPSSLLERPLLNIFMVSCEDSDAYKNSVRKQIKDWHGQVSQRKNQEWLILLVTRTDARASQTGLLKMRGTILDRMRADFNADKKDRCTQLIWTSEFKNPTTWAEVMSKVKDGIVNAFDSAVSQREDEIRRSESQKTMPGWNFCTFFILKESLATSFEGANLLEDALIQYDELEANFFQVLKDKTLWFGKFIEPAPNDDSLPLLSISKKPYRDLILANTISVFDLRVYLLARQCSLLGQLGRVTEIARKVSLFLGTFGKALQEVQDLLPEFFIESWIYSSCLSAIETCDEWARVREMDAPLSTRLNGAKGELFEISRIQLDKLGIRLGYLPDSPPFAIYLDKLDACDANQTKDSARRRNSRRITSNDIISLLSSKAPFYELYVRLTNKAIDQYVKAGRRKFALKLHGSLAALDLHRGRFSTSLQTYTSLPAHYAPHHWSSLESYMLFQSVETHAQMQEGRDRQWIHTVISFLKAYVEDNRLELLSVADKREYIEKLIEGVIETASELDDDLPFQDQPLISIKALSDSVRCANDQDGYYLDISLKNELPCALKLDEISLTLTGRDSERLSFITGSSTAESGTTTLKLFCPVSLPGTFLVDRAEVRIGKLVLQWSYNPKQKRRTSSLVAEKPSRSLVALPKDPGAVHIRVEQPRTVEIGGPSKLAISLNSGRNNLKRAFLRFSSPEVTIDTKQGVGDGSRPVATFSDEGVLITDIGEEAVIQFFVPRSDAKGRDIVKVLIDLEYITTREPGLTRRLRVEKVVPTALALTVNVQDFFRENRLLTNFTVSTNTHQHIRIRSVDLQATQVEQERVRIVGRSGTQRTITVTPAQPANFLFKIEPDGEVNDPLKLSISYRPLREEVEALLSHHVKAVLSEPDEIKQRDTVHNILIRALENNSSWVEMYEITGELYVPETKFDDEYALSVERVTKTLRQNSEDPARGQWRHFIIPVDLPRVDILATIGIQLYASPFDKKPAARNDRIPLYAGQPITATLTITSSFYWSGIGRREHQQYKMRFEVEEMIKDWLVSGQKRGDFLAKDGTEHAVTITLMALRHGEIPLPRILVSAFSSKTGSTSAAPPTLETYQSHGAEKLLILPRSGRTTFLLNVGRDEQNTT